MKETRGTAANDKVLKSLRNLYRAEALAHLVDGALVFLSVLVTAALLSCLLEMVFYLGPAGRGIVFFLSLAAVILAIYRYLLPHLSRYFRAPGTADLMKVALEAGVAFPDLKDRLRNAVELMSTSSESFHSAELARAYVEQIFGKASELDLAAAVKYRPRKWPAGSLVAALAAALLLLILFPSKLPSALISVVNFTQVYVAPEAYSIEVTPGNIELSRGDTLKVQVRLSLLTATQFPSHILVNEKYEGEKEFEKHRAKPVESGSYDFLLPNVRSSMTYFVTAGSQETREFRVTVVDLPIVQNFRVKLVYPAYTDKAPETLHGNIGDFTALVGTRAEYSVHANKVLRSAWIAFGDSSTAKLETSGTEARGSFVVRRAVSYTLQLIDSDSLRNRDPISYTIQAVDDEYPTCEITFPGKDVVLNRDMTLPLRISIGDDYGFTKLLLQYKLISSKFVHPEKNYHSIEIPLPSKSPGQQEISYTWDLSSQDLVPEDVISYHARVFDNDMVDGPKSTASSEYTLRLPSLEEVFASADSEHSSLESKTEDALNNSDELKNQLDKISEEMKTATRQMSWEQEKKMQNTLQRYDSLQKKVEGVKQQIENMTQKMLENKIISPQTLQKYLELQKALQEVNSPEFQEALKKLQQAIQSLNPEQIRQALKSFQMNDEMLRKSIERTLSLIKRIQIEQKLDELQARADQMLTQQESVRKATSQADSADEASRQKLSESQKDISKELAGTKRAMSDLKRMMGEFSKEMPVGKLAQAQQTLDSSNLGNKMQEAGRQLSHGNFTGSMSSQQQVSSALKRFKDQLAETQKSLLQNQQKATMDALRKVQQNLLEISKEQESLRDRSGSTMPNSPETRSLSDRQNELMQQLGYTAQQLMQLSDKSFAVTPELGRQIGEAYSQMQQAMGQLQSRSGQSPVQSQSQAMGSLNRAVMNIQSTMQSMMQGQGGGGFPSLVQQLQQLAGKQGGLNALTRELGEQGALSIEQQAEIARLAAQQEMVRKSLEQLAREAEQSQSQNRILGRLSDIAKQMGSVVNDLHNRNITQETIRRQEKILSHLLDASRSIRQRDYDNRRVTRTGTDVLRQSPGPLNLSNSRSEEERELLKLIRQNFPPEYQRVILKYYRLLEKSPE